MVQHSLITFWFCDIKNRIYLNHFIQVSIAYRILVLCLIGHVIYRYIFNFCLIDQELVGPNVSYVIRSRLRGMWWQINMCRLSINGASVNVVGQVHGHIISFRQTDISSDNSSIARHHSWFIGQKRYEDRYEFLKSFLAACNVVNWGRIKVVRMVRWWVYSTNLLACKHSNRVACRWLLDTRLQQWSFKAWDKRLHVVGPSHTRCFKRQPSASSKWFLHHWCR